MIPEKVLKHANQNGVLEKDRARYLKSWERPNSKSTAIKSKCVECCGFEDTVKRIRECSIIICPLNKMRPFQQNCDCDEDICTLK